MIRRQVLLILSLIMLVIELLDPTTPFIRSSYDSSNKSNQSFVSKNRLTSKIATSKAQPADTDDDGGSNDDNQQSDGVDQADYHAAVNVNFFVLTEFFPDSKWVQLPTGLETQFRPSTRKRPPIA